MAAAGHRLASDTASIHINTITEGVGTRRIVQYFWAAGVPPSACPKRDPICTFDGQTPDQLRMLGLDPDADLPSTTLMLTNEGWPRCRICGWAHYPDAVRTVKSALAIATSANDTTLAAGIHAAATAEHAAREQMTTAVNSISATEGVRWAASDPIAIYASGALSTKVKISFEHVTKSLAADTEIPKVTIVETTASSSDIIAAMKAAVAG